MILLRLLTILLVALAIDGQDPKAKYRIQQKAYYDSTVVRLDSIDLKYQKLKQKLDSIK